MFSMKKKNALFQTILVALVLVCATTSAQEKQLVDSLKTLIINGKEDTLKAKHLNDLVWYIKFSNPDTSIILLDQSEALSKKLDFANGLGNSYNNRAIIYTVKGDYGEALKYYQLAIGQFERINDANGIGFCYGNMAICFEYQSLFDSALVYNQKALEVRRKNDLQKGVAQSNINIGVIYFNKGFYHLALQHYQAALGFYENKPGKTAIDKSYLGSIQNNIGNIYLELKQPEKARTYLLGSLDSYTGVADSREMAYLLNDLGQLELMIKNFGQAHKYLHQALKYSNRADDKLIIINTLHNLGKVSLNIGQPDSALFYLQKGIDLSMGISDKKYAVGLYHTLGLIHFSKKQYQKAIQNYQQSIKIADEAGIIKEKDEALYNLAECYTQMGNHQKANHYLKLHIQAADSVMNTEKHRQIAEMEALYENEKKTRQLQAKEAENHQLQQDNELQKVRISWKNKLIVTITTGLFLITSALLMLLIQYRRKHVVYHALYLKNMEMLKNQTIKKKKESLKNGDLFNEIERRMSEEKLFRQKDLSRDTLADLLGTNREYVQQAIKDHAEKTVSDYISGWRIQEAMQILSNPEKPEGKTMLQISDEIGLSATSTTTFYALFKKYTEMTPSQFMKQSRVKS